MNDFVIQLDEEVEGMQATICALQDELKTTKTLCSKLEGENVSLRKKRVQDDENTTDNKTTSRNDANGVRDDEESTLNIKAEEMLDEDELLKEDAAMTDEQLLPSGGKKHFNDDDDDDERTLQSNGDSNLTDASEELPMDTESSITLTQQSHRQNSNSLRTEDIETDQVIRPNHVTVIRGTTEESYISPNKGIAKTSFSITDLLASSGTTTESVKKESDVAMEIGLENGITATINCEIDDQVV